MAGGITFAREEFGWCRSLSHSWTVTSPLERNDNVLRFEAECDRCGCTRTDVINFGSGQLIGRHYKHEKGYLFHFGKDNRPSKADVRATFFHQLLGEPEKRKRGRPRKVEAAVA